ILVNLLLNAGEAIGENHGTITVRIGATDIDNPSAVGFVMAGDVKPGSYVSIEVSDNGCGMDETTQRKIFEPFFSTKFLGRGLGLAAVAGIIRSHPWGLTVESTPGVGSTFRVFLRAAETAQQAESTRSAPPKPLSGSAS